MKKLQFIILAFISILTIISCPNPITPTKYTIVATAGTGGTISPYGSINVEEGSSQTFTVTPNSGYNIASVLVDGVNNGAISSYTFSNVIANHTISASFSPEFVGSWQMS
ncbi:MAG: hypothetical protein P8107_07980, partial [Spirochaetia bacterium]